MTKTRRKVKKKSELSIDLACRFGASGNLHLVRGVYEAFFKATPEELFNKEINQYSPPKEFQKKTRPKKRMSAQGPGGFYFQIVSFLSDPVTNLITGILLNDLYQTMKPGMKSALRYLKGEEKKGWRDRTTIDYSTWIGSNEIMLTVRIVGNNVDSLVKSSKKIQEAKKFGLDWLEKNGASKPYVTVIIKDGIISKIVNLDDIPQKKPKN